jgi:DNA adenine methylase
MPNVKSPLRYPGGKSRAIQQIAQHVPQDFTEYREPFVGGGSVFIWLRQQYPTRQFWINDLNRDVYCFWLAAQQDSERLRSEVWRIKRETHDGKKLFVELSKQDTTNYSDIERAVRFFVLNRITFSGTVDSGGYSQKAYESRFTDSSIERLKPLSPLLKGVRITNEDYRTVLQASGEGVFVFLDPPYLTATKSRLYGKGGILHTTFNHEEFAAELRENHHAWLVTYDDSAPIRRNFAFANCYEWELQYGMNNYKQGSAAKGKELFITNYAAKPLQFEQLQLL